MTLQMIEGFDHEGATSLVGKWSSGSLLAGPQPPRIAGASNIPQTLYRDFANHATWVVGFGILTRGSGQTCYVDIGDGATPQVRLKMVDGAGGMAITIHRGAEVALLATMPGVLAVGFWYYLELKVVVDNAGTYDLHVTGASVVSGAGDTQQTANAYANRVTLIGGNNSSPLWDDVYICDGAGAVNNTFLGDSRVETVLPNGAGASTQWTPSAGANYTDVDEIPPNSDTDYVSDGTVGDEDRYTHPALPTGVGTVRGTQLSAFARKDDAGARSLSVILHSGATDVYSPTGVALLTGYQYFTSAIRETDPDTGAAWTIAGVNATQIGVRMAA